MFWTYSTDKWRRRKVDHTLQISNLNNDKSEDSKAIDQKRNLSSDAIRLEEDKNITISHGILHRVGSERLQLEIGV